MNCPNCNAEIKSGFIKSNQLLSQDRVDLINSELKLNATAYCNSCGEELHSKAAQSYNDKQYSVSQEKEKLRRERENIKSKLKYNRMESLNVKLNMNIKNIPVLTIHTPYNWQYTSLGLVSGQIVTGTGLVSEIFSDFTDFFGVKSGSFTNKLMKREEDVLNQLRAKAILLGGNAVIATDIDYGEVGAGKGMLMVCAAGTAISLTNIDILGDKKKKAVSWITSWQNEKMAIEKLLQYTDKDFMEEYKNFVAIYGEKD